MRDASDIADQQTELEEELRLVVPGGGDFVSLARFAAGLLAARSHFDVEELQDLQLAVDELYASFGNVAEGSQAAYAFQRRGDEITVTFTTTSEGPAESGLRVGPRQDELCEQLLSALTDDHGERSDEDGQRVLWLRKSHVTGDVPLDR